MRLIATRQITVDSGTFQAGQEFDEPEHVARELLMNGIARKPAATVRYETKVILPEAPQVSARQPFRDVSLPDAEQAAVASEGNQVLPQADSHQRGTADYRGRRKRSGSSTG